MTRAAAFARDCACECLGCARCGPGVECPHDARISLPSPWREYAIARGGVAVAARELGVDRKSYRHWALGTRAPKRIVRDEVRRRMRAAGIAEADLPYAGGGA